MKKLLGKLAALVGMFLHSDGDNDVLRKECNEQERGALVELQAAVEQGRESEDDVDEGGEDETFTTTFSRAGEQKRGILNPTRRNDIRWAMLMLRGSYLEYTYCFSPPSCFVFLVLRGPVIVDK